MNKFKLALLFLTFSFFLFAQNHRISYEYSFKMDSLNKENIDKQLMILDITKDGSNYYSKEKFIYDSLSAEQFSKAKSRQSTDINLNALERKVKVTHSVSKNYPKLETIFHTYINGDRFAMKDLEKMKWNIFPEIVEIEGMKAQKATTDFGGRKWTAWFTTEIPFQDGPYKFQGLPGLILNLEDAKNDHVFKFVESKKLNWQPSIIEEDGEKELMITKQNFSQLWKNYQKDPAVKIRQIILNDDVQVRIRNKDGRELSQSEIIINREMRAKERLKKINNFLELNLYQ